MNRPRFWLAPLLAACLVGGLGCHLRSEYMGEAEADAEEPAEEAKAPENTLPPSDYYKNAS
ncbi:MAG: hypothetical protein ACREQY_05685 [Candidatus Binatia bacterium]